MQPSGISKYPALLGGESLAALNGHLCYFIRHYGSDGIIVEYTIDAGRRSFRFATWSGDEVIFGSGSRYDPLIAHFLTAMSQSVIDMLSLIDVPKCYLCYSVDLVLVDMVVPPRKFVGPGMLRDLFEKICQIQTTLAIEVISDDFIAKIINGTGELIGDLIVKPSVVKHISTGPLYIEIVRSPNGAIND